MKNIAFIILLFLYSIKTFAQQPADSTTMPPPPQAPAKPASGLSKIGFAAEIALDNLTPLPSGVSNNTIGGMSFAINLQYKFFLVKNNLFLSTGLGIATYDYATNAQIAYGSTNTTGAFTPNYSFFQQLSDTSKYKKNKLNLVWLQVPLELHYESKPNAQGKTFDWSIGGRFGLLINDHTKYISADQFGDTYKIKVYDIKNLNPIATMLTAKIGYDHANLFGYYNLLSLFKTGNGYTTNEFGAGISLTI